jgi:microcystin degradation protein MlrC
MNAGVETSMGPTAVLRIGGIDVVTISNRIQTIDLQVFLSQGIDPAAKSVLVVKSVQHFRAAYAPIAREIVLVDSGGICSPDIRGSNSPSCAGRSGRSTASTIPTRRPARRRAGHCRTQWKGLGR